MGKSINYLKEYRKIINAEVNREKSKALSSIICFVLVAVAYFSNLSFLGFLMPVVFTPYPLDFLSHRKIKGKVRELGFDSIKEFKECVDGTREYLETKSVPDELMAEEQNRIIEDFVKGKKERKWKDVPEMFEGGGISVAPPTKFRWNGMMELALSDDNDDED